MNTSDTLTGDGQPNPNRSTLNLTTGSAMGGREIGSAISIFIFASCSVKGQVANLQHY